MGELGVEAGAGWRLEVVCLLQICWWAWLGHGGGSLRHGRPGEEGEQLMDDVTQWDMLAGAADDSITIWVGRDKFPT